MNEHTADPVPESNSLLVSDDESKAFDEMFASLARRPPGGFREDAEMIWAAARDYWVRRMPKIETTEVADRDLPAEPTAPSVDWQGLVDAVKQGEGSVEISGVKIQKCDEYGRTESDEKPTVPEDRPMLSEYGRGHEDGLREASERQLRLAALAMAANGLAPGHASETVTWRAKKYLSFLKGEDTTANPV